MSSFVKPENALKRAEELIRVDQKVSALEVLHNIITSKRHRTWQPVLESIMIKYMSLCVEMRKGKSAKDGLHQYRTTCQLASNTNSLEAVIVHFLGEAEKRATQAQSEADQILLDIPDLEEESVENIILNSVSGEDSKDRSDREIITPWLKFLWETYRTILEILRSNQKLEKLYQVTARQAFSFCLTYKRNTEFRRLSIMLRNHLNQLNSNTYSLQQAPSLNSPETLNLYLETRFVQLNAATELELWQESFRTVEDIHNLMLFSKEPIPTTLMITYYQKLSQIFWVSQNHLFHAYALYRYLNLAQDTLSEEEIRSTASALLLATLSIPLTRGEDDRHFDFDVQKEKNARMAELLDLNVHLDRETLLNDMCISQLKVLTLADKTALDVYELTENMFQPLKLCSRLKEHLVFVEGETKLSQYVQPLQKLVLMRMLKQLSNVYENIKVEKLKSISVFLSDQELEKFILKAAKERQIVVTVDHQNQVLHFKNNQVDSDLALKNQLTLFAKQMLVAVKMINPEAASEASARKKEQLRKMTIDLTEEHNKILARKALIEKKKEYIEMVDRFKSTQEEAAANRKKAEQERVEKERLAEDAKKRAAAIEQKMVIEKQHLEQQEWANLLAKKGFGERSEILSKLETFKNNPKAFMAEQIEQIETKKKDMGERMVKFAKRMDYLERAKREEEIPLLLKEYEEKKVTNMAYHETTKEKHIAAHKATYELQMAEKKRYSKMKDARSKFEAQLKEVRHASFLQKEQARTSQLEEMREHLTQQYIQRKEELEKQREEEEKARIEEEERRQKLEEQREAERKEEEGRDRWRPQRDDTGPRREEGGDRWRPQRDERPGDEPRREEGGDRWRPQREERSPADEPRREEGGDRWRPQRGDEQRREEGGDRWRGGPRDDAPRGDGERWRSQRDEPRREEGGDRWRGGPRDEPRREEGGDRWRGGPRDEPRRDEGGDRWRGGPRDEPRRDEGGDRWRGGPRDEPRKDEGGDRWRGGPRDEPRREEGGDRWRGGPRDEPRREEGGDRWRDGPRGDDRPRDGGDRWRPGPRGDEGPRGDGDRWRSQRGEEPMQRREEGGDRWRSQRDERPRGDGDRWRSQTDRSNERPGDRWGGNNRENNRENDTEPNRDDSNNNSGGNESSGGGDGFTTVRRKR